MTSDTYLPETMLAARVASFGGIDAISIERVPLPRPQSGQVLIKVHAAGVGPWDSWVRSGRSALPQPLPLTLGADLAGTIAMLGPDIEDLRTGAAVYGVTNARFVGAQAEYAVAEIGSIVPKPPGLSFVDAAAVPVVAVTAWSMLFEHGRVELGQRVLIHGAAGNVGCYAVQMAKQAGAHVVATCFARDVETLRALGADEIVAVDDEPFVGRVRYADLVLDLVGGVTQTASFDVLVPGGRLVSSVSKPDQALAAERRVHASFFLVDVSTDRLLELNGMIFAGLKIIIGDVLPLSDVAKAHKMLDGAPHRPGKIVLIPPQDEA